MGFSIDFEIHVKCVIVIYSLNVPWGAHFAPHSSFLDLRTERQRNVVVLLLHQPGSHNNRSPPPSVCCGSNQTIRAVPARLC